MANKAVDTSQFKVQIAELKRVTSGQQLRAALLAGGAVVEEMAKRNIRRQGLIDEGRLRASIEAEAITDSEVIIGTNVIYAAIHEFGGVITPKNAQWLHFKIKRGGWVKTKRVTIPARPYLRPALDDNKEAILSAIREKLAQFIGGVAG